MNALIVVKRAAGSVVETWTFDIHAKGGQLRLVPYGYEHRGGRLTPRHKGKITNEWSRIFTRGKPPAIPDDVRDEAVAQAKEMIVFSSTIE